MAKQSSGSLAWLDGFSGPRTFAISFAVGIFGSFGLLNNDIRGPLAAGIGSVLLLLAIAVAVALSDRGGRLVVHGRALPSRVLVSWLGEGFIVGIFSMVAVALAATFKITLVLVLRQFDGQPQPSQVIHDKPPVASAAPIAPTTPSASANPAPSASAISTAPPAPSASAHPPAPPPGISKTTIVIAPKPPETKPTDRKQRAPAKRRDVAPTLSGSNCGCAPSDTTCLSRCPSAWVDVGR